MGYKFAATGRRPRAQQGELTCKIFACLSGFSELQINQKTLKTLESFFWGRCRGLSMESTIQDTARFARARKAFHHCHQCFILICQRAGLPGLAPAATCALAGRRRCRWRCLRGSSCTAVEAVEALLHLLEALGQHLDALDRQLQEVHRSSCSFVSQTASCLQPPPMCRPRPALCCGTWSVTGTDSRLRRFS